MISIECTHPDLIEFINLKTNLDICTKANISVRVSDEFMAAVRDDKDWELFYSNEHEAISKIVMYQDDNPDTFFREPLTDAEIISMRKLTIEGKTIYGTS